MLVLGMKEGESVMVGDNIEIKIVSAQPGRLSIGFAAPEEIKIVRRTLLNRQDARPRCAPHERPRRN